MIKAAYATLCLVPLVVLVASCSKTDSAGGSADETTTTTAAQPSIAVSVKPAPTQSDQGRPPVTFDPCFKVGDALITKAGFDPATRKRDDGVHDSYSFIGCTFDHKESVDGVMRTTQTLSVWSTRVTLDEFRQKEGNVVTRTTVNGREAITYPKPQASACYLEMNAPDGVLDVRVSTSGTFTTVNPCDRIQDVAAAVETALPK